ncbi:hypothetical protein J3R82DRAFT_4120 [Butyriboletus roseoflavus]|nr:hypothetical protein J3R82DRAFT_4120 [Butyriboletus roseoflavus]
MPEIIDLTVSPRPEIIEVSSDQGNTSPGRRNRTQENKKRKRKKGKTTDRPTSDSISSSAQRSRAHSPEIGNKHSELNESTPHHRSASPPPVQVSLSTTNELAVFTIDLKAAPIAAEDSSTPESNEDGDRLLLPSHVSIFRDDGPIPAEVLPPPKLSSDEGEYIEYLDYEDRKAPGLVRYFEVEGEESNQLRPSIFKCKNCGAEGDHKTYECPTQICLTCGARDEHSTRSCPISKTCYTCGMKGHINKTCPNRFSAYMAPSDFHDDCDRCGSTEHSLNECPTLWRIYQYVSDDERIVIMQSRDEKKQLGIGEGREGYIGGEVWCYNCANTGHLGDECDELPHPATFPTEYSAFSSHNVMSGPFYDPAAEPVSMKRGQRDRENEVDWPRLPDDWDAGASIDVGKRGKNKDKERLEKRFREQEDEGEDWFNDIRNMKSKGMDRQAPRPRPRGKTLKFGLLKDVSSPPPSLPTSGSGSSLLARLSDSREGRIRGKGGRDHDRREPSHQFENSVRIRGAATDERNQDGRYAHSRKTEWDRDKPGYRGSRRGHGPRYRGGYGR